MNYDAAFNASRLRCSNRARYTRRTKKSKLTSRPPISRRFATDPRYLRTDVSPGPRPRYPLLLSLFFQSPMAMTWPPPPSEGNPFQQGRYQTWTNRGLVTRRRPLCRALRDVPPTPCCFLHHPRRCARVYNLLNNSDRTLSCAPPCSFQHKESFNEEKHSKSSKMPYRASNWWKRSFRLSKIGAWRRFYLKLFRNILPG